MEKLTIKDLAKYIPYGVLAYNLEWNSGGSKTTVENVIGRLNNKDVAFEMRPLYQLIQEIEHDGEIFVPILELAKIAFGKSSIENYQWNQEDEYYNLFFDHNRDYDLYESAFTVYEYCSGGHYGTAFTKTSDRRKTKIQHADLLFEKLYEWHFWTGSYDAFDESLLIEKPAKK